MRQSHALIPRGRGVRRTLASACLSGWVLVSGCFKYMPVETTAVPPQEEVRVRVTLDAAVRIGPHLGSITESLEGRLTPLGPDSLALAVWIGKDYTGSPFENARQRVSLGRQEIVEVRRRTLSYQRTGVVAAGVLAITALLIDRVIFEPNPNPSPINRGQRPPEPDGARAGWRIQIPR